ncbi:glutamate--tRNA ligase [Candidatus Woesearchaeota archaeon]|nr:glutamate--tRNA ligase [Candidatus Woesearchaeota archaeon]
MEKEIKQIAKKYALQNAVKFNGTATMGNVIGKVLAEHPEHKKDIKEIQIIVAAAVKEINALSPDEQKVQLTVLAPELVGDKPKEQKHNLKELPTHPSGEIATFRFAPSPSGPLHIGHAYVISLNYLYAKKYKGRFLLRIEDTNPENIYPDAYQLIPEDAQWLTNNSVQQTFVQSDRMDLYYTYALKLLEDGHAYVCLCDAEEFRKMIQEMQACPCRGNDPEENVKRWNSMLNSYKQGEAVIRFKTDVAHKNPAMRDFPILRINESSHPRQGHKYKIWPLMNFSVAIDDMDTGVTHTLRGKDHADNAKRQEYIHKALGVDTPIPISVGRINFTGTNVEVSCSKTRAMIEAGEFEGWQDIRLPFVGALKRRGYQPEAFQKYAMEIGISQADKTVDMGEYFKALNAFNKEVIDPKSHRYFFVADPVLVSVKNAPKKHVTLDLHPETKKGGRVFETHEEFYLAKEDVSAFPDSELIRLMDCLNFKHSEIPQSKEKSHYTFFSETYDDFKAHGKKIIHWLPKSDNLVSVELRMPDNTLVSGYGEEAIAELEVGAIVQFERVGFCRLDEIEGNMYRFWFGHR